MKKKKKLTKKEIIAEALKTEEGREAIAKAMGDKIAEEIEEKELLKHPIFKGSKIKGTWNI